MRATMAVGVCVVLMGTALAQEATPAARARAEVAAAFARGDFEVAVKKAEAAQRKTTDAPDLAQLHVLRGQALLALGQAEKARAAFGAALQRDPTVELDEAHASPNAVRLLEKVRGELPATLVVTVKTGDADVSIDEKDLGPAPLQTQVAGGVHVVVARGAGGRTTRVEATVPPGRKVVLELELPKDSPPPPPPPPPPKVTTTPPAPPEPPTVAASPGPVSLGLLVGGGVVAIAGGVTLWQSAVIYDRLVNASRPAFPAGEGPTAAATGATLQTLGWVGVGVGVAAAATGGFLWWKDAKAPTASLAVAPMPGGVMVGLSGALPY